jgi:hypothetical protein
MDGFGVVYSHYWLQPKLEIKFAAHLTILKATLCQPKKVKPSEVWVLGLFLAVAFDLQRSLFIRTMKNNV